jgi:diaminopimelate epimerase
MSGVVAAGTPFVKVQALGNDFVLFDQFPSNASDIARLVCDRHRGVGADGCIFLAPAHEADVRMHILNADGTEAAQCGNALRCVAHVLQSRGVHMPCVIETVGRGAQTVHWVDGMADVDMGAPMWEARSIPHVPLGDDVVRDVCVVIDGVSFVYDAVSFGNPHCVVVVEDITACDVARYGAALSAHPHFPEQANVEFVHVHSRDVLHMRVWERGVGETQACGSGACAAMATQYRSGRVGTDVTVRMPGGDVRIALRDGHIWKSGPAATVFFGRWGP